MPSTIWKYPLELKQGTQQLTLTEGANLFLASAQGQNTFIWAVVDPTKPPETLTIRVVATGWTFDDHWPRKYLGTCFLANGALVFHVFQLFNHAGTPSWSALVAEA